MENQKKRKKKKLLQPIVGADPLASEEATKPDPTESASSEPRSFGERTPLGKILSDPPDEQ
jgi:hypothetical protein